MLEGRSVARPAAQAHPRPDALADQEDVLLALSRYASLVQEFQGAYEMVDETFLRLREGAKGSPEVPKLTKE